MAKAYLFQLRGAQFGTRPRCYQSTRTYTVEGVLSYTYHPGSCADDPGLDDDLIVHWLRVTLIRCEQTGAAIEMGDRTPAARERVDEMLRADEGMFDVLASQVLRESRRSRYPRDLEGERADHAYAVKYH